MAEIVATWDYHDADCDVVYQKCKTINRDGEKSYFFRRPVPGTKEWAYSLNDGKYYRCDDGVWRSTLQSVSRLPCKELPEVQPVLYRLPEILRAATNQPIVVVEGEKDADTLEALGFCSTTGPLGAGKWQARWGQWFSGRRVVVVPDYDQKGLNYAGFVLASSVIHGASSVRFVRWKEEHGLPEHGDITDWLMDRHGKSSPAMRRQAVIELVRSASEEWTVKPKAVQA